MKILILLCSLFITTSALAEQIIDIKQISDNVMEPIIILNNFVGNACFILGACSLFAAFLRYSQYRVNPLATPLSTVITLLIVGIVLLCLPLIYKLTGSGIPFHYF